MKEPCPGPRLYSEQQFKDWTIQILVWDSYKRGIIPSRELGMRTIWLRGPNPRVPEGAGAVDAWISSLPELEGLLS